MKRLGILERTPENADEVQEPAVGDRAEGAAEEERKSDLETRFLDWEIG